MIFVDTGPFLGRYLARDQHHTASVAEWKRLLAAGTPLATSNFVLDEALTLLARRAGASFAAARGRELYGSDRLRILRPDAATEAQALDWMERFADQRLSFTDCTSFALMQAHGIHSAFSFDHHFQIAGFHLTS